jgi:hypothetical protein
MTWARGRAEVEQLLAKGELERVPASVGLARRLLAEARAHLDAAGLIVTVDPSGAVQLAYDAARKSAVVLLAAQGLRATARGGHIAVQDAVVAQFGGSNGIPAFQRLGRLRRLRHQSEYPDTTTPSIVEDDASEALRDAKAMVGASSAVLEADRLTAFS